VTHASVAMDPLPRFSGAARNETKDTVDSNPVLLFIFTTHYYYTACDKVVLAIIHIIA
jgi:hypothetical protein